MLLRPSDHLHWLKGRTPSRGPRTSRQIENRKSEIENSSPIFYDTRRSLPIRGGSMPAPSTFRLPSPRPRRLRLVVARCRFGFVAEPRELRRRIFCPKAAERNRDSVFPAEIVAGLAVIYLRSAVDPAA